LPVERGEWTVKVIEIEHPQHVNPQDFPPLAIALGFFDGIHIGHQKVIGTAKKFAEELGIKSAVMTFDPHPSAVLSPQQEIKSYITPLQDKIAIIKNLDVDYLFVIHFTKEFASLLPEEFVDQYLINLNVRHVVAGFDYSYGRYGKGTMDTLSEYANGKFTHTIVERQELEDEKISSTRIRKLLLAGKFIEFHHLTGRYYTVKGSVIHGEKRGRKLGFPTANIDVKENYAFPATGVYAVRIFVKEKWYDGVCNVGYKPTFHDEKSEHPSVEVHILDFSGEIYSEEVLVEWHIRLRSEQKFAGLEELVKQIERDKQHTQDYFIQFHT
jgi:riboflavin kinase/FMN adenylyltransferase